MKIPIYEAYIDPTNEEDGLSCISIVDFPAMEKEMLVFNEDKKPIKFVVNDEMEHCITSVVIWADKPIYRYDATIGEYYIVFNKETIKQLTEKYSKDGLLNQVSIQHNGVLLDDITMVEYYIKDTEKGINPKGFEDVADGSLFATFKVNNEEVWKQILNGEFGGLSMEVLVDIEPTDKFIEEEETDYDIDDDFLNELLEWLGMDETELVFNSDEWLVDGDGDYWLDEDGNKVPSKCPKCGGKVIVTIQGEPIFKCSECGEYLGTVKFPDDMDFSSLKKKVDFKVTTRGDVREAIKSNRQVNLEIGEKTIYNQQIFELGKDGNGDVAVIFDPEHKDWYTENISNIKSIEITDVELEDFVFNNKWREITNNDSLVITETKSGLGKDKDNIDYVMDRNMYAMISYDDEKEGAATGFRTCFVSSWGYTIAGNEAIRIYEYSGDSKTGFEDGRWRFLLTRRIMDFKAVDYVKPIEFAPPKYNGERQAGSGKNGTMSSIKRIATFPPKINDFIG